jgi:hypothetical protein
LLGFVSANLIGSLKWPPITGGSSNSMELFDLNAANQHKNRLPKSHTYFHVCRTRTYTYTKIILILIGQAEAANASGVVRSVRPDRLGPSADTGQGIFFKGTI